MIGPLIGHLGEGVLLRHLSGELGSLQSAAVARHIERCQSCRARGDELTRVMEDFTEYWRARKAVAAGPPEPWLSLRPELWAREQQAAGIPFGRRVVRLARRTGARHPWMLGAVAAAVAAQIWMSGMRRPVPPLVAQTEAVVRSAAPALPKASTPSVPAGDHTATTEKRTDPDASGVELAVVATLHRIGADLGEPVEIRNSASGFELTAVAMDSVREREIREAFSGMPGVEVRFVHPEGDAPRLQPLEPGAPESGAKALETRLNEHFGSRSARESFSARTLESSAALLARLHALEDLDHRFPAEIRARFSPPQSAVLEEIRADHLQKARENVAELQSLLDSVRNALDGPAAAPAPDLTAVESASRLDTAIGVILGGAPMRKTRAEVLAELYGGVAAVRRSLEGAR